MKQVTNLEARVDDMEQYTRKNCVVQGIPKHSNEDVFELGHQEIGGRR